MKLVLISAMIFCVGCSASPGSPSNPDASDDGLQDAHPYLGPTCCQVTADFTDDPYWHNGLYACDTDGGLSVGTEAPWVCNVNATGMCGGDSGLTCLSCNQPECTVGMACLGFNGTGVVTDCQPGD